ncbi:MAG: XRE family transcriptional regulator [Prevotellaceae bacterium]|jgi:hypothetical protein|nr:XRE family transcriptional regulator [Prevotellaceae bacterium]
MKHVEIHIGNMIKDKLFEQKRSIAWLAKEVGCHPSHLPRMLKKKSFDSDLLCRISCELNENFLEILSQAVAEKIRCKNAT